MMTEWEKPGIRGFLGLKEFELIKRRRRQMLVHSYIYYRLNTQVIPDSVWQRLATELVELQAASIEALTIDFYDDAFSDWDGSTGYHLPADLGIARAGAKLLQEVQIMLSTRNKPVRRRLKNDCERV